MAFFEIPVRNDSPAYTMSVELEGLSYNLLFQWNTRAQFWTMTLSTQEGEVLLAGAPVLLGKPLLKRFANRKLPPGDFLVMDTQGRGAEATLSTFGQRVILIYRESTT